MPLFVRSDVASNTAIVGRGASGSGRNYLLLSLFVVLLADQVFGFGLSLLPGLSFKNLYLYFIIACLVGSAAVQGQFLNISIPRFYVVFVLLCIYGLASWAISSTVLTYYSSLTHAMSLKNQLFDPLLFFSVTFFGCRNKADAVWLAKRIFLAFALINIVLLMDFVNLPDLGLLADRADGRLDGAVGGTNGFATLLGFFLLAMSARTLSRDRSLVIVAGTLAGFTLVLLSGSRGALAGLVASGVVTTFLLRGHLDRRNVVRIGMIVLLTVAVIAAITFILHPEMFLNRLDRSEAGTLAAASSGRTVFWTKGLLRMWQNPHSLLIGFGWDTFVYSWIYPDPHSHYLFIFYSTGAVGLGMYLWIMFSVFKNAARALDSADAVDRTYLIAFLYGFVALLFGIAFSTVYTPWPFLWSYIGLMSKLAALSAVPSTVGEAESLADTDRSEPARQAALSGRRRAHT